MSESGPLDKGSDASDIAMWMSNVIIQDLRDMKPDAWIDWQVSDPSANWCTIQTTQSSQSFKYTGRYYMHAAFSRFIRPGSRIIASSDANSVAALVPSNGNLVVVVRNAATASASYTVDLSKFGSIGSTATVYRFSLPGSLAKQADIAISNKQFSFTAPSQTLTTLVIPGGTTAISGSGVTGVSGKRGLRLHQIDRQAVALELASLSPYEAELFDARGMRVVMVRSVNRRIWTAWFTNKFSQANAVPGRTTVSDATRLSITSHLFVHKRVVQIAIIATDGESSGHFQFGDMVLACPPSNREQDTKLTVYGESLESHPPTHEAKIHEPSAGVVPMVWNVGKVTVVRDFGESQEQSAEKPERPEDLRKICFAGSDDP